MGTRVDGIHVGLRIVTYLWTYMVTEEKKCKEEVAASVMLMEVAEVVVQMAWENKIKFNEFVTVVQSKG